MAKHLGEFGQPREALTDTFGWMNERFRIHPDFTDLSLVQFMEQAVNVDENDEARAMELVLKQFHGIVHEDDYARFLDASIRGRQNSRDLMELMKGLNEAIAGRPTRRPSGLPSGGHKTKGKSKGGSSKRVIDRLADEGRPDLALAVVAAEDARRTA